MRKRILPYKMGSQSARLLSLSLDALRVRHDGAFRPRDSDFIINWGSGVRPSWMRPGAYTVLNQPEKVAIAANKLKTFQILQEAGVAIPEFTTNDGIAVDDDDGWLASGYNVYARTKLTGHSGEGIVFLRGNDGRVAWEAPVAPLYVKAVENHGEYRVHVVNGEVVDYIKKRRRNGEPATEEENQIRNLANGWVYTRENLRRLDRIEELAIDAVTALELDFGAVDIIKDENGDVFVLEVNTACGMSDSTLNAYTEAFNNFIETYA